MTKATNHVRAKNSFSRQYFAADVSQDAASCLGQASLLRSVGRHTPKPIVRPNKDILHFLHDCLADFGPCQTQNPKQAKQVWPFDTTSFRQGLLVSQRCDGRPACFVMHLDDGRFVELRYSRDRDEHRWGCLVVLALNADLVVASHQASLRMVSPGFQQPLKRHRPALHMPSVHPWHKAEPQQALCL